MTSLENRRLELPSPPWIVGHRGAAGCALENTEAAIACGIAEGATMVEIDVQLSADRVPILFHDWDLRRLAGRSEIVERTPVDTLLDIRLPDPFGEAPSRILTLEAALAGFSAQFPLNLELKRRFHEPRHVAEALSPILETALAGNRPLLLSSFDWTLLSEIRRSLPHVPVAPLGRWKADELLEKAAALDAFSIHAHHELAPALTSRTSLPVVAYTVNDQREAKELIDLGVTGVFTDTPGLLRSLLASQ
jgi:glycerophosphoryl diester phosphodiesterase